MSAAVIATGSYLPEECVTNADLERRVPDTSAQWILSRAGIEQRYWAGAGQATSDLAVKAAQVALDRAGIKPSEIALTICATSSPDHPLPATASIVQGRLGAGGGAFDLNGVCSGFVSALATGFAFCQSLQSGPVLVIGADTYSRWLNPADRGPAVFFGDGAGAVVIARSAGPSALLGLVLGSDGTLFDRLMVPMGGSRQPATAAGVLEGRTALKMDGKAVWEYATRQVPQVVREVVARAGLRLEEVDWLIPHQANKVLLEACREALGLPPGRLVVNVDKVGNTAAASVPIALDWAATSGRLRPGQHLVLVGFGGGMAHAAVCLRWDGSRSAKEERS